MSLIILVSLGTTVFNKLFPVILTDNVVEFKGPHEMGFTDSGVRRTRIFYCDPLAYCPPHMWRRIGSDPPYPSKEHRFLFLQMLDIFVSAEDINSVPRESFDNRTHSILWFPTEQEKLLEFLKLSRSPSMMCFINLLSSKKK